MWLRAALTLALDVVAFLLVTLGRWMIFVWALWCSSALVAIAWATTPGTDSARRELQPLPTDETLAFTVLGVIGVLIILASRPLARAVHRLEDARRR